jgi:YVTN family beta-propeller protein
MAKCASISSQKNRVCMKGWTRNLSLLFVILICSTISSAVIVEGLLVSGVRADSTNFIVHGSAAQSFLSSTNARVYVVNLHDNTLSIISGQTKTVLGNATMLSKYPAVVAFGSSASRNTYVVNLHDNTLSIISGQTKTVLGNVIFVNSRVGETTFGLSNVKSNIVTTPKVVLPGATTTKASNVAAKTASAGTSPTRGITNNHAKAVTTKTPPHPPMIP